MYSFLNDYQEACAPEILDFLLEHHKSPEVPYGLDRFSEKASKLILSELDDDKAAVHFVAGGTQANMLLLSSVLKPFQAVISATTGHINVHETGAIEGRGHKILTIPSTDGKIYPKEIEDVVMFHRDEHMVMPKLVYISQTTELGTIYSLAELKALRAICDKLDLYLYIDGARLGSALTSEYNDVKLSDLKDIADAFTIGGTKNGLLFGEALVLVNSQWHKDFRFYIKHQGAMLAKGFVLGMQFYCLFKDNLFYNLASHANVQAKRIADELQKKDVSFHVKPESNQLFLVLDLDTIDRLKEHFKFSVQDRFDDSHYVCRFVTTWTTSDESVDALIDAF